MKPSKVLSLLLGMSTSCLFASAGFSSDQSSSVSFTFPIEFLGGRRAVMVSDEPQFAPYGVFASDYAWPVRRPDSEPPPSPHWVKTIDWSHITKEAGLKALEEVLRGKENSSPEVIVASYAAALASQNSQQDFFGYDFRDYRSKTAFQEALRALEKKGYDTHPLLDHWIHQPNAVIKMAGFLDSFGTTLSLADSEVVGATLPPSKIVNPSRVLEKAYTDLARLISGQVVAIDEHKKATPEEERVLIQAAQNLGYKKAMELGSLRDEETFKDTILEGLLRDYNLLNLGSLNQTTLRHNAILLSLSLSAALGRDLSFKDHEIEKLLKKKGFALDVLQEVDAFRDHAYRAFGFLRPSESLEDIIAGRFDVYEPAPTEEPVKDVAAQALQGIDTLGIDRGFVYDKLAPYGQGTFDALRNPKQFIDSLKRESEGHPFTARRRRILNIMLDEIEWALGHPLRIHELTQFGYGNIVPSLLTKGNTHHHDLLTRRTWLSSCYDFVVAYYYAKNNDCITEFYADATPPENAPCLPAKIRGAQEWFESKNMLVNDAAGVLEKVFAGMAGIELASALPQLYRKYIWASLEVYRAEKGGISAEEAQKQEDFKKEYLTLAALKEGLLGMVVDNLPTVIRKYRMNRSSPFPIAAFHSYKYAEVRLRDGLGPDDNGLTNHQEIAERQAQANIELLRVIDRMIEVLRDQGVIDVYQPA